MENMYQQDDFDRQFRADLKKAGQGAKPDPKDWDQLLSRLQDDKRRKRLVIPVWLPWLLLGAALGWNGFTSMQLQRLETRLSEMPISKPMVAESVSRSSVVIYDTIYRTVIITEKRPGLNPAYLQSSTLTTNISAAPVLHSDTLHSKLQTASHPTPNHPTSNHPTSNHPTPNLQTPNLHTSEPPTSEPPTPNHPTSEPPTSEPPTPNLQTSEPPTSVNKVKKQYHYQLEVGFAASMPLQTRHVSYNGLGGGRLAFLLELNKHWQLNAAVFAGNTAFKNETLFEERLLVPAPEYPAQEFKFKYVEGNLRQFIPSLGIQYASARPKKWNWNAGLSYAALIWAPDGLEYEFFDPQNGTEYNYEAAGNVKTNWLNLELSAGGQFQLKPQWAVYTRFGVIRNLKSDAPALLQGALGIRYRLR